MALTTSDVAAVAAAVLTAIRKEPNGLLFRESSATAVYAVNIVDGTKRHISKGQSTVMNLANVKPLIVPDGSLDAFTTVT